MENYLVRNSKMMESSERIFNFGIPAYKSKSGLITCPSAGICKNGCYATMGTYIWEQVQNAYERRLKLTQSKKFSDVISEEIQRRDIKYVRIHDSGDFYNSEYLSKWIKVMELNPSVTFYAYTKQVKLLKSFVLPDNFKVIYSFGGKQDKLINTKCDRHSKVFMNETELKEAGYVDASKNDAVAFQNISKKIGLIYHGYKSRGEVWKN